MKAPFDEMNTPAGEVREQYRVYERWLERQSPEAMRSRRDEAEMIFGAAAMIESEFRVEEIQDLVFPHPTTSEIIRDTTFSIA